ncbi:uncharacterized protein LOC110429520 [Sorghum bicolor]|uniref:uncharacterized protein LOC110429520 n=1 Tax=Sorghum bicolor TaxID=4558 RepID=UPI000B423F82|nr:uncharacterized protein LOC110429520 [Sorghum bicolor]|eukprot:XP_021315218.1 uncharacterized protein LOC110429520 [Sorghum bicolor]
MSAATAAAAARCVPLRASPPETAKSSASVPTSSAASASASLRAAAVAAGPGRRLPAPPLRCSSSSPENSAPPDLGLLLEVEGVLPDVYRFGNRQAFNVGAKHKKYTSILHTLITKFYCTVFYSNMATMLRLKCKIVNSVDKQWSGLACRVQVYLHKYEWFLPVDFNTF